MIAMKDRAEAPRLAYMDEPAARAQAAVEALMADERSDEFVDGVRDAVREALGLLGDLRVTDAAWEAFTASLTTQPDDYQAGAGAYLEIFAKLCAEIRAAELRERISGGIRQMYQAADVDDAAMSDWARGVVADSRELHTLTDGGA